MKNYIIKKENDELKQGLLVECENELNEFAFKMSKKISGILPISEIIDKKSIYIETSKYLNLKEMTTKATDINREEILLEAVKLQIELIKHLLPLDMLLFDMDYCFYDYSTKKPVIILLPFDTKKESDFRSWAVELLKNSDEEIDSDNISGIIRYIKSESFCLKGLKQRLEERTEKKAQKKEEISSSPYPINDPLSSHNRYEQFNQVGYENINSVHNNINAAYNYERYFTGNEQVKVKTFQEKKKAPLNNDLKKLIISQILFLAIFLLISFSVAKIIKDPVKAVAGVFLIVSLIDYVVVKYLMKINLDSNNLKGIKDIKKEKINKEKQVKYTNKKPLYEKREVITKEQLYEKTDEHTVLLNNFLENRFSLVDVNNGIKIPLIDNIIKIGRKKDIVNVYLNNPSIGREHAVIKKSGNHIFIKDNNSLNGSYINGIRLRNDDYVEIQAGDTVSFSNLVYTLQSE